MSTRWKVGSVFLLLALAGAVLMSTADSAEAQATAVVTSLRGQVRVMPKGATAFQPLQLGMRVSEGADIVAPAGANAQLQLPDGSTLMVAENTRFVVTKLDYDQQNRMRSSFFHLATGKLRAFVNKAAASLVAARQANFAITTPTAVAAVRGTELYASYDASTGTTNYYVTGGTAQIVVAGRTITVYAGQLLQVPASPTPATVLQPVQVTAPAAAGQPGAIPAGTPPVPAADTTQTTLVTGTGGMTSTANPATTGTATVLGATAVVVTSAADVVNVVVTLPPVAGPAAPPPTIVVTPVEPPPGPGLTNPSDPAALPPTPSGS